MANRIETEAALDEVLTTPRPVLVEAIRELRSPLVILGAGGKMGPSLAVLARRAAEAAGHELKVIAVSRFTDRTKEEWLQDHGVKTVAADLLDRKSVRGLPDAGEVLYMVGLKFGTEANPSLTPALVVAPNPELALTLTLTSDALGCA